MIELEGIRSGLLTQSTSYSNPDSLTQEIFFLNQSKIHVKTVLNKSYALKGTTIIS